MTSGKGTMGARPTEELDEKLIERLVARDERAFNELVRVYGQRISRFVHRMIGNAAEAEDLTQEVFVQVFKAIGSFRGDAKLSTWMYRIATNLCTNRLKYLRVRQVGRHDEIDGVADHSDFSKMRAPVVAHVARPDEVVFGRALEDIVRTAMAELDPSFRECLVLRDVEDLSYEEIEAITGLPAGTVKSRIFRGRAELKAIVERRLGERIG